MYIGNFSFSEAPAKKAKAPSKLPKDKPGKTEGPPFQPRAKAAEEPKKAAPQKAPPSQKAKFKPYPKKGKLAPHVELGMRKKDLENARVHLTTLKKQEERLSKKIKASLLYFEATDLFMRLDPSDQAAIRKLVTSKTEIIDKLGTYQKLKENTEFLKDASKILDVELDFWGNLATLKTEGVSLKRGSTHLKMLRPTKEMVHVESRARKKPPVIKGVRAKRQPTILDERGRAKQLGEEKVPPKKTQEQLEAEAKEQEKKLAAAHKREGMLKAKAEKNIELKAKFYGTKPNKVKEFIKTLPSKFRWKEKLREQREPERVRQETQTYIRQLQRVNWDIRAVAKQVRSLHQDYAEATEQARVNLARLKKSHADNGQVASAIGILVNLRPNRFVTAPNLHEALASTLSAKTISTFSGFGDVTESDIQAVDKLLRAQKIESEEIMTKTAIKSAALDIVKSEVKGEPPPPRKEPTGTGPKIADSLPALLLLIAGGWLAFKIFGGR